MAHYIVVYFCTALIFLAIDFVWLGYIAKDYYISSLGHLMLDDINLKVATSFYLLYAVGIVIFAVHPALSGNEWKTALIYGALFGFFCYATYDLTNMATLKDWPASVSFFDMAWGTFVTGVSSTGGFFLSRFVLNSVFKLS